MSLLRMSLACLWSCLWRRRSPDARLILWPFLSNIGSPASAGGWELCALAPVPNYYSAGPADLLRACRTSLHTSSADDRSAQYSPELVDYRSCRCRDFVLVPAQLKHLHAKQAVVDESINDAFVSKTHGTAYAALIIETHVRATRSDATVDPLANALARREDDVEVALPVFNRLALQGAMADGALGHSQLFGRPAARACPARLL